MKKGEVIRVLLVDDSATARLALRRALQADGSIEIVAEAGDGSRAVELAVELEPDVVLMDIVMPGTDGLSATRRLLRESPRPVLVISDQIGGNADMSFEALRAGALEVIGKPSARELADESKMAALRRRVRVLAGVPVITRHGRAPTQRPRPTMAAPSSRPLRHQIELLVIGASTGGPPALQRLISALPNPAPWPVVIVQHMARGFIGGMVSWLISVTDRQVVLATDRQLLEPGVVYVAPDDNHLRRVAAWLRLDPGPPDQGHKPAVDMLFSSAAEDSGARHTVGILLTGMGRDGAEGLAELRRAGGWTISQDEASSVVYGMPKAAAQLDAASEVLALDEMAAWLTSL